MIYCILLCYTTCGSPTILVFRCLRHKIQQNIAMQSIIGFHSTFIPSLGLPEDKYTLNAVVQPCQLHPVVLIISLAILNTPHRSLHLLSSSAVISSAPILKAPPQEDF
jgi:hypothetical protein